MATQPEAEDPDLKAAQLDKLRAETAKLGAERNKLEEEAKVLPHVATGSYWSEAVKILGAIVLGIGGFVTAAGSYFVARNQVELAELKSSYATEKAKVAESTASTASAAAAAAVKLKDEAKKEEAEAVKNTAELRKSLAEVTAVVQAAKPELLKRRLVYIQFQGSLSRSLVDDLRKSLESQSFSAPGAERLSGEYQNLVKFFRVEDESAAALLLKSTQDFFASKGCPIQLRTVQAKAVASTPPLELWLSHSCKQQ